jgi:ICEA Protein
MTTTNFRTTPRGLYHWNSSAGRWYPSSTNKRSEWENTIICDVFRPNAMGVSRWVGYEELRRVYAKLCPDNPERALALFGGPGGNGSNFFTRDNHAAAEFSIESRPNHRREETRFNGIASNVAPTNQAIPQSVRRVITSQDCAFTGKHDSTIVVDHKDGRHNTCSNDVNDFQPLTQAINKLKATACGRCIASNQRFDARSLGYGVGWINGDGVYRGSCVGCYWHDIHYFRSSLTLPPDQEP